MGLIGYARISTIEGAQVMDRLSRLVPDFN